MSFRARVVAFYEEHNPSRLCGVDEILAKYENREDELWRKLTKKYALDFGSTCFDASRALREKEPVPGVQPLDNLSKCRSLLPASSDSFDSRIKKGPHHSAADPEKAKTTRSAELIQHITDPMRRGPFSLLWRALYERRRVKVVVRGRANVRGNCVGLLKAFDRHMNLVLYDVVENIVASFNNSRRGTTKSRSVRQLFVRGDGVVLVCFV